MATQTLTRVQTPEALDRFQVAATDIDGPPEPGNPTFDAFDVLLSSQSCDAYLIPAGRREPS
jgi:hypothetical protein